MQRTGQDGTHYYQTQLIASDEDHAGLITSANEPLGLTGALTHTLSTVNEYDEYGNVTRTENTTQGLSGSGQATLSQQQVTENDYGAGQWLTLAQWGRVSYPQMSRLVAAKVRTTLASETRERQSRFEYHQRGPLSGLLKKEVIAPNGGPEYTVSTRHHYDGLGNATRTEVTGWNGRELETRHTEQHYDSKGRYSTRTVNGVGQIVSEVLSRNAYGQPSKTRTLNGISATIAYDVLGRERHTQDNTGAWKKTVYLTCKQITNCPSGTAYAMKTYVAGGGESVEYYDTQGRTTRQSTLSFNGQWAHSDVEYNTAGSALRQSEPYFNSPTHWTTTRYDSLARPVHMTLADGSEAFTEHNGLSHVQINQLGHRQTETNNALGQLERVTDNLGAQIRYQYTIDGELSVMQSYHANGQLAGTTTLEYDALGRKIAMNDPDKGEWRYRYNAFGELINQTDANGQSVRQVYDSNGRMTQRLDYTRDNQLAQATYWQYDNSTGAAGANNSRGQLTQVRIGTTEGSTCGQSTTLECTRYTYDNFGRNISTERQLHSADGESLGTFVTANSFDELGRPHAHYDALNGMVSDDKGLINSGTYVGYNKRGYADTVTDIQSGKVLQQIINQDARGNTLEILLANGARTYNTYDAATGQLTNQKTSVLTLYPIQDIDYQWDVLGNLNYRHNKSGGKDRQEAFCYDGLNRLVKTYAGTTQANCAGLTPGQQDLRYDSFGNITYKHDVGEYTYGNVNTPAANDAGRHAVIATSDGKTYQYDNNGNMTSDRQDGLIDRALTYSTFVVVKFFRTKHKVILFVSQC